MQGERSLRETAVLPRFTHQNRLMKILSSDTPAKKQLFPVPSGAISKKLNTLHRNLPCIRLPRRQSTTCQKGQSKRRKHPTSCGPRAIKSRASLSSCYSQARKLSSADIPLFQGAAPALTTPLFSRQIQTTQHGKLRSNNSKLSRFACVLT